MGFRDIEKQRLECETETGVGKWVSWEYGEPGPRKCNLLEPAFVTPGR